MSLVQTTLALILSVNGMGQQATPAMGTANPPTQVRISYGEDPTRMMRVVWQTKTPTDSLLVKYGTTDKLEQMAVGHRPTYAYETGALAEVTLYNLKPNTTYFYRCGSDQGGWSDVQSFRTADPNPKEFVFTAFGDHGVSADAVANVQNVLFEKPAFHLLLGDISYANGNQPIWDTYLAQIEPMTRSIPYMLCYGNHENEDITVDGKKLDIGYIATTTRFAMPGFEQSYAFDYGNARFVTFNSDDYRNPVQQMWLDRTLAEARRDKKVKWLVVFEHHPLYGTSKGRGDNEGLIKAISPILDRYKVDLVLAGHDHHYERQYPMRDQKIMSIHKNKYKKGEGTLYMIQGGGGRPQYDFSDPKPDKCAIREKTNGYVRITVPKKGPLKIEAKRIDRSLIEVVEIAD